MLEAVGSTGMRYKEECRRVKQVLLVITPNTMVYFARSSKAFQYLGPKVGYSANLCDAEYPYHFYCEPKEQADVLYARMVSRKVRRRKLRRRWRKWRRGGTLTGMSRTCC